MNLSTPLTDLEFIVIDFETITPKGRSPEPIELAAIRISPGLQLDEQFTFECLISIPDGLALTSFDSAQTGLTNGDFEHASTCSQAFNDFMTLVGAGEKLFVAHNAHYEARLIKRFWPSVSQLEQFHFFDSVALAKRCFPGQLSYKLDSVAKIVGEQIPTTRHRALPDSVLSAKVFIRLLTAKNSSAQLKTLADLCRLSEISLSQVNKAPPDQMVLF